MSQDSERNDRPRRTGERRDDVRNQSTDRPRFNRDRDTDRNNRSAGPRSYNRSSDTDRPRFQRDDRNDRPNRPDRSDNRNDERRGSRSGSADGSRFSRDNDRSAGPRSAGPRNAGPRNDGPRDFESRRSDNRRQDRDNDSPRPSRFSRDSDDRYNSNRNSRSQEDKPRFERGQRNDRSDRRERPDSRSREGDFRSGGDRNNDRFGQNRPGRDESRNDERPRFNRESRDGSSRFSRDRNRDERSDKPSFRREGGFNRDADDRNNDRFANDRRRSNRNEDDQRNTRFTSQQRKESGDRRTGEFTKAPNYNLEQTRFKDTARQSRPSDKPRRDRPERSDETEKHQSVARRPDEPYTTRLNRYIANSGVCSRREADELIARGDISVNGKVVTEMGFQVKDGDTVKYGTKVLNPERFVYVLLNKPKDYITTTDDPEERKTVMELVADAGNFRMYPVGRLDRNTTGLLLLTNDGELADKLTHPSNNIRKIYQVELDKPITEEHFSALKKGIDLEDGPIKPDAISIVTPDAQVVGIEIHSGRNRIVRRMFEQFGYEVTKLDRTTYAGLTKKELPRGKWRFLDPKEVVKLKYLS